jgi:hypothetical protein
MQLRIAREGNLSSKTGRQDAYTINMQDAIIGGGVCTDWETLGIRGVSL